MTYSNKSNLTFTNDLNPLLTCNYDIDLSQRDINFSLFSLTEVFILRLLVDRQRDIRTDGRTKRQRMADFQLEILGKLSP